MSCEHNARTIRRPSKRFEGLAPDASAAAGADPCGSRVKPAVRLRRGDVAAAAARGAAVRRSHIGHPLAQTAKTATDKASKRMPTHGPALLMSTGLAAGQHHARTGSCH